MRHHEKLVVKWHHRPPSCCADLQLGSQAQVASAEADKQQLLEAFIKERAKREAEALAARRVLEAKLEAAVSGGCTCHSGGPD